MAFGLPAFFGRKARTITPPGLDITSITDISGSMGPFAEFISSATTFEALETALAAEQIGTLPDTPNKYSFCVGGDKNTNTLPLIERNFQVSGTSQRWALGSDILANPSTLTYPTIQAIDRSGDNEDMALATNIVSNTNRGYNTENQRIIISGSDEQTGQENTFDQNPLYSYRYIGVHSAVLTVNEVSGLPAIPSGTLVGFVYTTASAGVAIYIDGTTINYRTNLPTSAMAASPSNNTTSECVDQCKITNGAIYNIEFFDRSSGRFALLATSLGKVLGQFLYSVS